MNSPRTVQKKKPKNHNTKGDNKGACVGATRRLRWSFTGEIKTWYQPHLLKRWRLLRLRCWTSKQLLLIGRRRLVLCGSVWCSLATPSPLGRSIHHPRGEARAWGPSIIAWCYWYSVQSAGVEWWRMAGGLRSLASWKVGPHLSLFNTPRK